MIPGMRALENEEKSFSHKVLSFLANPEVLDVSLATQPVQNGVAERNSLHTLIPAKT